MMAVLDIADSKVPFVMELLDNFSFVKIKSISEEKAVLLSELREAIDTVNLVKRGEMKANSAKALLDEI
jgi:hypothetical protein